MMTLMNMWYIWIFRGPAARHWAVPLKAPPVLTPQQGCMYSADTVGILRLQKCIPGWQKGTLEIRQIWRPSDKQRVPYDGKFALSTTWATVESNVSCTSRQRTQQACYSKDLALVSVSNIYNDIRRRVLRSPTQRERQKAKHQELQHLRSEI